MTDVAKLGQMMTNFVTTVRQDTDEIYGILDDAQDDRLLMSGQLNMLHTDRHSHDRTARLMKSKARLSYKTWVQFMDTSNTTRAETVGHDVAYVVTWTNLKKKMTDKYCPRGKIKKLEVKIWNLKVKGTDV
nr:putative reverse transcriptase domain-containing protein [Tanacetum cinerariifolium]